VLARVARSAAQIALSECFMNMVIASPVPGIADRLGPLHFDTRHVPVPIRWWSIAVISGLFDYNV